MNSKIRSPVKYLSGTRCCETKKGGVAGTTSPLQNKLSKIKKTILCHKNIKMRWN